MNQQSILVNPSLRMLYIKPLQRLKTLRLIKLVLYIISQLEIIKTFQTGNSAGIKQTN